MNTKFYTEHQKKGKQESSLHSSLRLLGYIIILLTLVLFLFSCKTASKLYEKGRYDEAVELAAKKLQKDPNDPKLLDVLQKAYRFAVDDHESRIATHAGSHNELKWEWTYNEYISLQRLYDAIRRSPEVYPLVNPVDYSSYVMTYKEKAGEVRFQRGLDLMSIGDKNSFRKAYRELQTALAFLPGDVEVREKMNEAYNNALINVVVLPMEQRGSFHFSAYDGSQRRFDDNVMRFLQNNNSNEFVRYYSAWDANGRNLQADYVVDIRFSGLNIGRQQDEHSVRTVSKDVLVKETVYRPDSVIKEYAKVTAKITSTTRSIRSEGLMQVSIRDEINFRTWNSTYSGQHFWATDFATYTGDARALSEADKQLLNRNRELPPSEDHIIRIIMNEVEGKVECGIRDYFYQR